MSIFRLPDLGEGLIETKIREWYVKAVDTPEGLFSRYPPRGRASDGTGCAEMPAFRLGI